jgi:tripartite-type tricarboxylate transporter receptor subunit TctC
LVVNPAVPANSTREFIALAKRESGKLNYGSAGPGSVNHLALELLEARTGVQIAHVPYRGIADATKDLPGGQIQTMTASIPATLPLLAEKRVKVLAVTGPKRIPQLPGVPSWQEEGVPNAETQSVLAQTDVKERLEREGAELIPGPPERLGTLIDVDLASWKKLITEARLSFE